MSTQLPIKAVIAFFFRNGTTQALFRWLSFRLFVAQQPSRLANDSASLSVIDCLEQWEQQTRIVTPVRNLLWVLTGLAALIGFSAMATVLNVTGNHPINIWVPLALFAFLPLLLTLSSVYFSFWTLVTLRPANHPFVAFWMARFQISQFQSYPRLLFAWIVWQSQRIALVFSVSAVLAFFLLATFQDYQFGWSSTLIRDDNTMTTIMHWLSWPWHWLVDAPSAELIRDSRFTMQSSAGGHGTDNAWWQTLILAIAVYGVLPRVLLSLGLRYRLVRLLRWSIQNTGDIEQFIVAQQRQASVNPIQSSDAFQAPENIDLSDNRVDLISWQQPNCRWATVRNLGSGSWLEDEQWLQSAQSKRARPVAVLVAANQTPTGELADSLAMLKQANADVSLVFVDSEQDPSRYATQLKSWQYFAHRQQITLKKVL